MVVAYASVMRIVHVSDAYVPRIGGLETQVCSLAEMQAGAGHEVFVLTATLGYDSNGAPLGEGAVEKNAGVEVRRLARKMPGNVPVHPRQNSLIVQALQEIQPDVVHTHAGMISPFSFAGIRQALKLQLPIVVTWHSTFTGWSAAFKAKARLSGWHRAPVAWTAVGSPGKRHVERMLKSRRTGDPVVQILPNGVDVAKWAPSEIKKTDTDVAGKNIIAAPWQTPDPNRVRIVATQRLEVRKRTIPLLRAVARARELVPAGTKLELLIVGTGSQDGAVKRWIERNSAGHWVKQAGQLTRDQLTDLYRHTDVFAAPAQLEAFGIAALEARSAGLAVVARSGSGVADFVDHRVSGLLVDDDEAFAGALAQLASEPHLLARIKDHNVAHLPPFDWQAVLQKTDQEYARAKRISKTA